MSKADTYRRTALSLVGEEYQWGEEPLYDIDPDANPLDGDCSGTVWALWKAVGVGLPRSTAEGFRRMGVRIVGPAMVGADFWVLLRSDGTAHHIGAFIGLGETFEARGEAWGMVKSTVAVVNARGAKWYRMPGIDLGVLTQGGGIMYVTIREGDSGPLVGELQERLRITGAVPHEAGTFGPETTQLVRNFQASAGLVDDGIVGPATWGKLIEVTVAQPAPHVCQPPADYEALKTQAATLTRQLAETRTDLVAAQGKIARGKAALS
jgi:hypothetical protein